MQSPQLKASFRLEENARVSQECYDKANQYKEQGMLDQALRWYHKAAKIQKAAHFNQELVNTVVQLIKLLEDNGQWTDASQVLFDYFEFQSKFDRDLDDCAALLKTIPEHSVQINKVVAALPLSNGPIAYYQIFETVLQLRRKQGIKSELMLRSLDHRKEAELNHDYSFWATQFAFSALGTAVVDLQKEPHDKLTDQEIHRISNGCPISITCEEDQARANSSHFQFETTL